MIAEIEDYAIIMLDTEGKILNLNKGAQNIKGNHADEIIGRNFSIFYQSSDIAQKLPQMFILKVAENGKARHQGWSFRKDGTTFWGYIVITALHARTKSLDFLKSHAILPSVNWQKSEWNDTMLNCKVKMNSCAEAKSMIAEVTDYAIILILASFPVLFYAKRYTLAESFWAYSYSILYTFGLFWITPYAIATAGKSGWLTRDLSEKE